MSTPFEHTEQTFFRGKRPWSRIKDKVLSCYLPPYLAKVSMLNRDIILLDAFAGPGIFEDGEAGSPLIMCQLAEKHASVRCRSFFMNRDVAHHASLESLLTSYMANGSAYPIFGEAADLLSKIKSFITDQTIFLYLDPFGLTGWEFSTIRPFLARDSKYSTEVLINLSIPTMHRLAARKAVADGRHEREKRIQSFHERLTCVLGGDYWKEILWEESLTTDERASLVISKYREKLKQEGAIFSGSCPVREKEESALKYYLTFCSRHPDALLLMNDIMCRAYQEQMHVGEKTGTIFENTDWQEGRNLAPLCETVMEVIKRLPGRPRKELWLDIVQSHFMLFTASEYKKTIALLNKEGKITFDDIRKTGRLNDDSLLYKK